MNSFPQKKPLVRVPDSNVADLIEKNKLTLIDATVEAIGAALGPIEVREPDKARLRVHVNGLEPLIMKMDLQLPSSDVVEVELDYEKLDKQCFLCKSLTHEKDDCPLRQDARYNVNEKTELGISQRNALERIAEGRRRQDDRRYARVAANSRQQWEARWTNARPITRRSGSNSSLSRDDTRGSSEVDENRRRFDDRYLAGKRYVSRRLPHRSSQREGSTRGSHDSSLPKETHVDNHQLSHSRGASSRSNHSLTDPGSNLKITNIASRLSDPRSDHGEDRNSALARLPLP
ncbi:unnamed protein product [Brassica oleracea]